MIYLDWNATAPLEPAARAAWLAAQEEAWANPASAHAFGQAARHRVDESLATLARRLGCAAHELVLTGGGTEANATAIAGAFAAGPGDAVCSAVDHTSITRNAEVAAQRAGGRLTQVRVDGEGRIDAEAWAAALHEGVRLVCLQFANNELGTLHDVAALAAIARARAPRAWLHCDACQGPGKAPLALRALGVDSAAIAGHKFGAPKGVGLLWIAAGRTLPALLLGGRQQQDRRSGTEDAALAAALAAALSARAAQLGEDEPRLRAALDACFARIAAAVPDARWLGRGAPRVANTLNVACAGVAAEILVTRLDLAGFAVSKGSACIAKKGDPSRVVAALGLPDALARGAIRVSIGPTTREADLAAFADAYAREVAAMRAAGR